MSKNLVVGAGFSGAVAANLLAEKLGENVLVIDKRNHLAGNCHDYRDENGIMIHKYGSHIFHTNSDKVWKYISNFTEFNSYEHMVLGSIDGIITHIPFNFNTLYDVFPVQKAKKLEEKLVSKFQVGSKVPILEFQKQEDADLKELAQFIYEKIFLHYTQKQWGLAPENIDSSVTARVPVYLSYDNKYFQDKHQGIPKEGYTKVIEKMLDNKNIEIKLNTDFKDIQSDNYDRIFYTGSIDEFFSYKYGKLPYRSVNFKYELHDKPYYQSNSVVNYPTSEDFTRIHEYKYYLDDKSEKTVIAKEFSEEFEIGKNERYYPIPKDENIELYNKYSELAKTRQNIYFMGRLGDYKYYNIDGTILRTLELFEELFNVSV